MIDSRDVWMGGYGVWKARGAPTGVHDPIMVYSWIIADGNTTVAFMVADVIGISNIQLDRIRFEVNELTSIPIPNIHIASTHTHSGVDMQGLWGGASQEYKDMFVDLSVQAIVDAHNNRQLAYLYASKGNGTAWARNRRNHGWTNDEMTIINAYSVSNGLRLGTVLNFAVHPVVLDTDNLLFSADFVAYFRDYVREGLGGDAPVAFVNGAEGDVNPRSGEGCCYDTFDCCQLCGSSMATSALQFVFEGRTPLSGPLSSLTVYYNHRVSNPAFILAHQLGWLDYYFNYDNETNTYSFDTLLSYWTIGADVQAMNLPGESLSYNSFPILQNMTAPFRMIYGLTGDAIGYLVPTDEWDPTTGYEEKVCIDKFFGDSSQTLALSLIS